VKNLLKIIKPALILFLICALTTAALVFVNQETLDTIKALTEEAQVEARKMVLGDADSFAEIKALDKYIKENPSFSIIKSGHYGKKDDETVGAVYLVKPKGYGGEINIVVGIDKDGIVQGIQIGDNNETPGLGSKAAEKPFYSQFTDIDSGKAIVLVKTKSKMIMK
jgi:electron transport complex protein RnfG